MRKLFSNRICRAANYFICYYLHNFAEAYTYLLSDYKPQFLFPCGNAQEIAVIVVVLMRNVHSSAAYVSHGTHSSAYYLASSLVTNGNGGTDAKGFEQSRSGTHAVFSLLSLPPWLLLLGFRKELI